MDICSLCLKEILESEISMNVDGRIRHLTCSEEYDSMIIELKKIYENTHKDFENEDI